MKALSPAAVHQYRLGGHSTIQCGGRSIYFEDHGAKVSDTVWRLYREAILTFGAKPTVVEWDTDALPLERLLDEAYRAGDIVEASLAHPGPET